MLGGNHSLSNVEHGKVSGAWLFKGTRVPVAALFDNLEDGASVKDFWNGFRGWRASRWRRFWNIASHSLAAA